MALSFSSNTKRSRLPIHFHCPPVGSKSWHTHPPRPREPRAGQQSFRHSWEVNRQKEPNPSAGQLYSSWCSLTCHQPSLVWGHIAASHPFIALWDPTSVSAKILKPELLWRKHRDPEHWNVLVQTQAELRRSAPAVTKRVLVALNCSCSPTVAFHSTDQHTHALGHKRTLACRVFDTQALENFLLML